MRWDPQSPLAHAVGAESRARRITTGWVFELWNNDGLMRLVAASLSLALAGCNAIFSVNDLSFDAGEQPGSGGAGGSAEPSCDDGIHNGNERDVDCGGDCAPCAGELGASCSSDSDCDSGHCALDDGVCCDTRCDLECEACLSAKTGSPDGFCDFVLSGIDPDGECDATEPTSCGASGSGCSGTRTSCVLFDSDTFCAAAVCDDGTYQADASCDGLGGCPAGIVTQCGPFACDVTGCFRSCNRESHCDSVSWCQDSQQICQPKRSNGESCSSNKQCLSGNCDAFNTCVP